MKVKKQILEEQSKHPDKEICGFLVVVDEQIEAIPTKNHSINKEVFVMDGVEYLKTKIAHEICGVFHTHVSEDEKPSDFDKKSSDHVCLPFLIYSLLTDKFSLIVPEYVDCNQNGVLKLKERFND